MTCKSQEYVDGVTLSICINGRCCRWSPILMKFLTITELWFSMVNRRLPQHQLEVGVVMCKKTWMNMLFFVGCCIIYSPRDMTPEPMEQGPSVQQPVEGPNENE